MKALLIKSLLFAGILSIATVYVASADSTAPGAEPGSVDDPVITKSYFDQNIANKVTDELTKQSITEAKVKELISAALAGGGSTAPPGETPTSPVSSEGSALKVVQLQPGQTLLGAAGTEIIVRSGKVLAVSDTEDGIPDVTIGKDVTAGAPVELNHLLIVPREGRGIKPDPKSKTDIYVMVRGGYTITNAADKKATP
ncbi:hypothetical protein [Paenibacillus mucilaginosus]|uniref:Uncharacterized protein n=1 Tax=Paenibacillus mucilaginosus (strain KNP414) TaxID=1036673 RepID=F8FJ26_PAEMK|nr:hypothetical protein [Paenibacillus mucilaginosus]AEI38739.1 hypothetical protein KNP414_00088 [Paenibacillus mucilaginosus KNP414]MCG7215874.1 hypothetical protein [Paenibacillus mucilaginosus]WDM27822.1 hypothetical protein KCX80_00435 [Paenibacillus mucilaginosus]